MGWGDVRLGLVIGLLVSFPHVLWALSLGIMAGALVALGLIVARRGNLASQMPYAPFLCLGAVLSLLGVPFFFVLQL
jgi:leader peptidase (prepilin peptidase)/N-methyltransferase